LVETSLQLPSGYSELLQELKARIRAAQVRAALAISRELVLLYWSIGRDLSERFERESWGGKIIDRLANDLQTEFPGVEGYSPRNLRYMRSLAGLAGGGDFATTHCKIALGPQSPGAGSD
jgi:predicted nuclease of restriction endonuclease-like (RecB) superfamily